MLKTKKILSLALQNLEKYGKILTLGAPRLRANVIGNDEGSRYHTDVGTGWVATQENQR